MATSNIVISEGQVTFKGVQGHKHDGITSTLIDTSKYSIFDFIVAENAKDSSRADAQANRKKMLKTFIIDTIEERVLNPAGIRIQANTITAREIVSGTITADQLSSNIILVNNVIKSSNYINNTGTYSGWAIFSNGTANFNNVNIRGNLATGNSNFNNPDTPLYSDINGNFSLGNKFVWTSSSNSLAINAGNLTLGSNLTWNGNTLTVKGTLKFPDDTSPQSQNATDGFIGGININSSEIQSNAFSPGSAGFRISANGNAEFNNVTVRGDLRFSDNSVPGTFDNGDPLTAGTIGGVVIWGSGIYAGAGAWANTNTPFYLDVNGYFSLENKLYWDPAANLLTISGSISASTVSGSTISGTTITTGTWNSSGSSTGLRLDNDGYITGSGDGVKIRNYGTDGTDGITGTKLFGNTITTSTFNGALFSAGGFQADGNGITMTTTGANRPLDLQRAFAADAHFVRFYKTSGTPGESGKIRFNAANGLVVAYDTTSDVRLKTNIKKIENAIGTIKMVEPVEYTFIEDSEGTSHGFIAQDLYAVYEKPVYVGGEDPREDPWSIDYSKMVPIITAALKESIAKVEELEARIQTLEGV